MTSGGTDAYTVAHREDAIDVMVDGPRVRRAALVHERDRGRGGLVQLAQDALPGTGGRGSYGHRHQGHEEIYFVISGVVTFKIDDDVFEAGPQTAIRVAGDAFRSVHNDAGDEAELLIVSPRSDEPPTEKQDDFWPST